MANATTYNRFARAPKPTAGESLKQRRHRPDYQIVLFIGLLMLLGLIIMYAIGPQRANVLNTAHDTNFYTSTYFVIKQSLSLILALAAFGVMAVLPLDILRKHGSKILMIGLGLCALLFLTGNLLHISAIAQCSLGACRWFELGPLGSFQPAELLKFGLLTYLAGFLGMRVKQGLINDVHKTIIPLAFVVGLSLFFTVVVQKDMGTGIALTSLVAAMITVSGISAKLGLQLLGVTLGLGVLMIIAAPHRMERVATFFGGHSSTGSTKTSDEDANDADYHIRHAKLAIGSGGLFGVGIGNSVQATGYLPEAINDSVFAIMGETFGFVGLTIILALFTGLLMRLLRISDRLKEPWQRLMVAGVFGWLFAHVVLNVASMIGVFPLTGITLPLLSFGGTSMIFIAAALGVAFQLSRFTSHEPINKESHNEDSGSRRGVGRPRNAGRRSITRS